MIVEGASGATTAYYTSSEPISSFKPNPAWFSPMPELTNAYHTVVQDETGSAYTYEVNLQGVFLSRSEVARLCSLNGVEHSDLEAELSGGPSDVIKLLSDYGAGFLTSMCDGFHMNDYDPRNPSRDVESILVFNPSRTTMIVSQVL